MSEDRDEMPSRPKIDASSYRKIIRSVFSHLSYVVLYTSLRITTMQDILRDAADLILSILMVVEKGDFNPSRSISLRLDSPKLHALALEEFETDYFDLYLPKDMNGIASSKAKYMDRGGAPVTSAVQPAPVKMKSAEPAHERAAGAGEIYLNPKNTFTRLLSATTTTSPTPPRWPWPRRPANPTIRSSFTAASAWARRICSVIGQPVAAARKAHTSLTFRPRNSRTNTLTESKTTSSAGSARNIARPTCC